MAKAAETTHLLEEVESGPGSCFPCRKLAPVSIPIFEKNRHQVLWYAHYLCFLGVVLSAVGFLGAYSSEHVLAYIPWMNVHSDNMVRHGGVRWVCGKSPSESGWKCKLWSEAECSKLPVEAAISGCKICKGESIGIAFSVVTALITYFAFYHKTNARLNGNDSNLVKFGAVASALIGGTNFLLATFSYWSSCIIHLNQLPGTTVYPGIGLVCVSIAAVLKVLMGVMHLGLPVERSDSKKTDTPPA